MGLLDNFDVSKIYGAGGPGDPLIALGMGLLSQRGVGRGLAAGMQNVAAASEMARQRSQDELRNKLLTAQVAKAVRPEYGTITNPITGQTGFFNKENPAAGLTPIPGQTAPASPTFMKSPGGAEVMVDAKGQPHFAPAATNVTVTGEKAYDQSTGKAYGEQFMGYQTAARNADSTIGNLKTMRTLTENPDFYSGAGEKYVTQARKVGVALGLADAAKAAPNELFSKLSNKAVMDASGGSLGVGISSTDRDFLAGTVPNLANTPDGNRQIIDVSVALENRKKEIASFARDYAKSHGGRIDQGFDEQLAQWANEHPMFAQQPAQPAAGGPAPSAPAAAAPPGQPQASPSVSSVKQPPYPGAQQFPAYPGRWFVKKDGKVFEVHP